MSRPPRLAGARGHRPGGARSGGHQPDPAGPGGHQPRPVRLVGARALVTGASSGIGAATAEALASAGVRLAISGRDALALKDVAVRTGAVMLPGDLTDSGRPAHVVADATAELGDLDIVVSNAGAGWSGPFVAMTEPEIDKLIDLNLRAAIHLLRAATPGLLAKGRGHIVVVGSIAGLVGVPNEAVYSGVKAGLVGLTEALRPELAAGGVKVTLVSPGVVDTPFFARRNRAYERGHPVPIPATAVADAIVDCLRWGRPEAVVPRWLALPARLHGGAPRLYRSLASRFG